MRDRILHSVTNRANDFVSPVFSRVSSFQPSVLSADAQVVHDTLQLGFREHDYYVAAILNAIDAFPEVRENFNETERAGDVSAWRRPSDSFSGGSLVVGRQGPPNLRRLACEFPVAFRINLSYADTKTLCIQLGSKTEFVAANPLSGTLYPEWPASLGISGGFQLSGPWTTGWTGSIYHVPVSFPWKAAVTALTAAPGPLNSILLLTSLVDQFYWARRPIEQIAVAALALGLSNPGAFS